MSRPASLSAILFDWDGTLADSVPVVTRATNQVLVANGYSAVTDAQIHEGMRLPTRERMAFHVHGGVDAGAPSLPVAQAGRLAQEFYATAERLAAEHLTLFPGVRSVLHALHGAGVRMAIVTNNHRQVVMSHLALFGLEEVLPVVIGEHDVTLPKPNPEGVTRALAMLGADTGSAVFVGDSRSDAQAGRAAGVRTVGVTWAAESVARSEPGLFHLIVGHPGELVGIAGVERRIAGGLHE